MASQDVVLSKNNAKDGALVKSKSKTNLEDPTYELTGHEREIWAARFDPAGQLIASASLDKKIMLWQANKPYKNLAALSGHKLGVLDLQWSQDSQTLYSASADQSLASWDVETGQRTRRYYGHENFINAMAIKRRGEEVLVSVSDDETVGIWDPRQKEAVNHYTTSLPLTAVAISETGNEIFTGSLDEEIKVWEVRKGEVIYSLKGHAAIITSVEVSPDGQSLLTNALDSTVRTWDIRPFATGAAEGRALKTYDGAPSGVERNLFRASFNKDGSKIIAGSGDGTAVMWDAKTGKILHKLGGHRGAVNDARFCPTNDNLVLSASTDTRILISELDG